MVTTRPPAARAASTSPAGAAAPPSRMVFAAVRSSPASSIRRSWAGTTETCAQPLAASAPGSSRPVITGSAPASSDRTSTWIPAMWKTGRQHSHRSPGPGAHAPQRGPGRGQQRGRGELRALGRPGGAGGGDDQGRVRRDARRRRAAGAGARVAFWPLRRFDDRRGEGVEQGGQPARGRAGSSGRMAGPVPSRAAASAPSIRPAGVGGGQQNRVQRAGGHGRKVNPGRSGAGGPPKGRRGGRLTAAGRLRDGAA